MSIYSASFDLIENVRRKSGHFKGKKSSKRYSAKYTPYNKKLRRSSPAFEGSPVPAERKFSGNVPGNHPDEVVDEILFRRMEEKTRRISYRCEVCWMGLLMISTVISGLALLAYNLLDLKIFQM